MIFGKEQKEKNRQPPIRTKQKVRANMNKLKYSVLMSVYAKESAQNLRQAMESMLRQTMPPDDFVLVCDGPLTPELDSVIEAKQVEMGQVLQVIRLPQNGGLGHALNEGLKHCKNELVARMDSDDISAEDRCEKQLRLFAQNPDVDISSGTLLEFSVSPAEPIGKREVPLTNNEIREFSKKRCPFNHPCVMFKKTAVEKAGGYKETYHLFEDYYLWIRMLQINCQAQNLPDVLLFMRTPNDMYKRRGGKEYAKSMLRFHWWVHKSGWTNFLEFCTGALPHALVCVVPTTIRKIIYKALH